MPKITVLMALYNGGAYLKYSIESILNQTHRDFEFLIINDCSTDGSIELIQSYADPRIRIHRNPMNIGQTKSLNVGLKLAQGDYIARVDADDIAFPNWLEAQRYFCIRHPEHSVISVHAAVIDGCGTVKKLAKMPSRMDDIILRSIANSPINHVGSFLKKKTILDYNGYDENLKTAADYDLWTRLIQNQCQITTNDEILMAIRSHESSLSRTARGEGYTDEMLYLMRNNINYLSGMDLAKEDMMSFFKANYEEWSLSRDEFEDSIEKIKEIYSRLIPDLKIQKDTRASWFQKQYRTLYLKQIYRFISEKNVWRTRALLNEAINQFGLFNVFGGLWIMSLFGSVVLSFVPGFYKDYLCRKARLQMRHCSTDQWLMQ